MVEPPVGGLVVTVVGAVCGFELPPHAATPAARTNHRRHRGDPSVGPRCPTTAATASMTGHPYSSCEPDARAAGVIFLPHPRTSCVRAAPPAVLSAFTIVWLASPPLCRWLRSGLVISIAERRQPTLRQPAAGSHPPPSTGVVSRATGAGGERSPGGAGSRGHFPCRRPPSHMAPWSREGVTTSSTMKAALQAEFIQSVTGREGEPRQAPSPGSLAWSLVLSMAAITTSARTRHTSAELPQHSSFRRAVLPGADPRRSAWNLPVSQHALLERAAPHLNPRHAGPSSRFFLRTASSQVRTHFLVRQQGLGKDSPRVPASAVRTIASVARAAEEDGMAVSERNGTAHTREVLIAELRDIRGAAGAERDRRIAGFLTAHEPLMGRIAWQFGSRPAICWDNDGPGLVATVREEAWRMLAAIGSRDEVPAERFWDQLHVRARSAIRELVESGVTTGFGGGTGACRRRRSLRTSAAAFLRERGRPASVDELVEFHDQRMRKRRADPSSRGPCCRRRMWWGSGSSRPTRTTCPETCCVEEAGVLTRHAAGPCTRGRSWPGARQCRRAPDRSPVRIRPPHSPISRPRRTASGPGSGGRRRPFYASCTPSSGSPARFFASTESASHRCLNPLVPCEAEVREPGCTWDSDSTDSVTCAFSKQHSDT